MSEFRAYLFRIVCCGFFVSLAGSLPLNRQGKTAVRLCGGCLLALTVLQPLIRLDPGEITARFRALMRSAEGVQAAPWEKNEALLQELTEAHLTAEIQKQAASLGCTVMVQLQTEKDPASGGYVPTGIDLRGSWTEQSRASLALWLREELGLSEERQRWIPQTYGGEQTG